MSKLSPTVEIKEISFEEIFPIWRNRLWPTRQDPIKPLSSMTLSGAFDMAIYDLYTPCFLGAFVDGQIVGVNSCHLSSNYHVRSRGLFVDEAWRRRGIATQLLNVTEVKGLEWGALTLWSYPKNEALNTYLRAGFEKTTSPPPTLTHSYVTKKIASQSNV